MCQTTRNLALSLPLEVDYATSTVGCGDSKDEHS